MMMKWLRDKVSNPRGFKIPTSWPPPKPSGHLPLVLRAYPPYNPPYSRKEAYIDIEKAEKNLQYLLNHKAERLKIFEELMELYDIDFKSALKARNPSTFFKQLHWWACIEWPSIFDKKYASITALAKTHFDRDEKVFSLIYDTGIAMSEFILRRKLGTYWHLHSDPQDVELNNFRQPVLFGLASPLSPSSTVTVDLIDDAFTHYTRMEPPLFLPGYRLTENLQAYLQFDVVGDVK